MTRNRGIGRYFENKLNFYYSGAGFKPVFVWFGWPLPLYKSDSWLLIHGFDHWNAAICLAFPWLKWPAELGSSIISSFKKHWTPSTAGGWVTGFDGITLYLLPVICLFQILSKFWNASPRVSQNASCFPLSWVQITEILWAHGGCPP